MSRRRTAALLLALAIVPALAALHARSFFSPDECYYVEVAREMRESGDFVVPRFDGKPWFEKPPLLYWLLSCSFAIFGDGFPAAVLLNALLTGLAALFLADHVRRTATARAGLLAAFAYLTMFLPMAAGRTALTDPALVLCTTASIVLFLRGGTGAAALSGVFLGLGVLAKGPVAPLVVLPALVAAAWRDRREKRLPHLALAAAAALAVALPWHLAIAARGYWPQFREIFFGQQVMSRAVDSWRQEGPWWFYLPALWAVAFPWGTHLVLAARRWAKRMAASRWRDPMAAAEALAVVVPLFAFSMAKTKLPHYLLPLLPWLAAWLGRAGDELLGVSAPESFARRVALVGGGVGAAALLAAAYLSAHSALAPVLPRGLAWLAVFVAVGFAVFAVTEWRGHRDRAWLRFAVLALVTQLCVDRIFVPALERHAVERPLAEAARAHLPSNGVPVAFRWWRSGFVAYGPRGWIRADSRTDFEAALGTAALAGRPVLVLTRSDTEGEARAAVSGSGGVAREVTRISGLGEIDGTMIEGIVFLVDRGPDPRRAFWDADRPIAGEVGFSGFEGNRWTPSFRWCAATRCALELSADPTGPAVVRLRVWGPTKLGEPQRLRLVLNDRPLQELSLSPAPLVFAVPVAAAALAPGRQRLELVAVHTVVPADQDPTSTDKRHLAFALDWLAFEPASPRRAPVRTP